MFLEGCSPRVYKSEYSAFLASGCAVLACCAATAVAIIYMLYDIILQVVPCT